MQPDTSFSGIVKSRRIALGLSQAALADLVGRSASAIRGWERGSSTPTDENVVRSLAAVLGIEEDALRGSVGMPADAPVEELEEVGGEGLAVFAEYTDPEESGVVAEGEEDAVISELDDHDSQTADKIAGEEVRLVADATTDISDDAPEQTSDLVTPEAKLDMPAIAQEEGVLPVETPLDGPEAVPATEGIREVAAAQPQTPPAGVEEEPDAVERDSNRISVPSLGGMQASPPQPVAPAATVVTTGTRTFPIGEVPAPPVVRSYLEDPDQMMTYWIRAALTVAFVVFLLIVLFWALGNLGDAIGEVWDIFKAGS